MNMARAILEGIHEVELQLTPEFQKKWPAPEEFDRISVGPGPSGNLRFRIVYRWPNGTVVSGLEVKGLDEFNAWAPECIVKPGGWAPAMRSISATGNYPGGVFVYVESYEDSMWAEIDKATTDRAISAFAIIKGYQPGEEPVVDHFLGYEAKPASEQPKLGAGPTGPTYGVPLLPDTKLVLVNRPWMHVTHLSADVTESNPVMVLTKSIPIDVAVQDKKRAVQGTFEDLKFQTLWSAKLEAWRIWSDEGQTPEEFDEQLNALVYRVDEIIDAAEDT